jgi:hypothetical protein
MLTYACVHVHGDKLVYADMRVPCEIMVYSNQGNCSRDLSGAPTHQRAVTVRTGYSDATKILRSAHKSDTKPETGVRSGAKHRVRDAKHAATCINQEYQHEHRGLPGARPWRHPRT